MAKRFTAAHLAGIENGIGTVIARMLPWRRSDGGLSWLEPATIDGDTTDVEVYSPKKQDAVYKYQGQRAYRAHIVVLGRGWVHAGR